MRDSDLEELLKQQGFYESAERSVKGFRTQPSESLDIQRAMNARADFWYGTKLKKFGKSNTRKKILIAHRILHPDFQNFYEKLFSLGFEIYVWQGRPVPCPSPLHLHNLVKESYFYQEELFGYKKLGYYTTEKLIWLSNGYSLTAERPLDKRHFYRDRPFLGPDEDELYQSEGSADAYLSYGSFGADGNQNLKEIYMEFDHASLFHLPRLYGTSPNNIVRGVISNVCQNVNISFEEILKKYPSVEYLDLPFVTMNFNQEWKNKPLISKLKRIKCAFKAKNLGQIDVIFESCPELEEFEIRVERDKSNKPCEFGGKNILPKLRRIFIGVYGERCGVSTQQIEALLNSAPNLEVLDLHCVDFDDDFSQAFTQSPALFSTLNRLSLNGSRFRLSHLRTFFKRFPSLVRVDFGYCAIEKADDKKEWPASLPSLKEILAYSVRGPLEFSFFISSARNLVGLDAREFLDDGEEDKKRFIQSFCQGVFGRFTQLRDLKLDEPLSPIQLTQLLKTCPSLESLSVETNFKFGSTEVFKAFEGLVFPELKTLNLKNTLPRIIQVLNIHHAFPNLKILKLQRVWMDHRGIEDHKLVELILYTSAFDLRRLKLLPSLEKLTLYDSKVIIPNADQLSAIPSHLKLKWLTLQSAREPYNKLPADLLSLFPNLEFFELSSFKSPIVFPSDFNSGNPRLPKLLELRLFCNSINKSQLKILIKNSPNLSRLTIEGCENIKLSEVEVQDLEERFQFNYDPAKNEDSEAKITTKIISSQTVSTKNSSQELVDIDVQTQKTNNTFHVTRFFQGPHAQDITHYRMSVRVSENVSDNFIETTRFVRVANVLQMLQLNQAYDHGKIKLDLTEEWQVLPSLSPNDEILALQCQANIELGINRAQGLYYIRSTGFGGSCKIEWLTKAHFPENRNYFDFSLEKNRENLESIFKRFSTIAFDEEGNFTKASQSVIQYLNKLPIQNQIALLKLYFIKKFESGDLKNIQENSRYFDKINAIISQKKGSCRHRANAFYEIARALDFQVRLVTNACHRFCEIQQNGEWHTIDLGGYPGDLMISDLFARDNSQESLCHLDERGHYVKPDISIFPELTKSCPPEIKSPENYKRWLLEQPEKNALLIYDNTEQVDILLDSCFDDKRIFYLDSLKNIEYEHLCVHESEYQLGDSALIQFIKNAERGDTLIIRQNKFREEHIGYNSLFDLNRRLGQIDIPPQLKIILLIPRESALNYGPDFYSRFQFKTECRLDFKKESEAKYNQERPNSNNTSVIPLYESADWPVRLLGQPAFSQKNESFNEAPIYLSGSLKESLQKSPTEIIFRNPPESRKFKLFYRQIQHGRRFFSNGEYHEIPNNIELSLENIPYEKGKKDIPQEKLSSENSGDWDLFLDSSNFSDFLALQKSVNGNLIDLPGHLQQFQQKKLTLLLRYNLSPSEWAQFFEKIGSCDVQVIDATEMTPILQKDFSKSRSHSVVITNDQDYVVHKLHRENSVVLSINPETEVSQLLGNYRFEKMSRTSGKDLPFRFPWEEGALISLLREKKAVILKGVFSRECEAALATLFSKQPFLLVNGERFIPESKITIVSENERTFDFVSERYELPYEKHQGLSFSQEKIPSIPVFSNDLKEDPDQFDRERAKLLLPLLEQHGGLILEGDTSVGKSTFIRKFLFKLNGIYGYSGLDKIKECVNDTREGLKIIYIDEYNILDPSLLAFLEGNFNPTPGFLIDKKWMPSEVKIILVRNPHDYEGRISHPLLERHLPVVKFDSLPFWYLEKRVIQPLSETLDQLDFRRKVPLEFMQSPHLTVRDIQHKIFEFKMGEIAFNEKDFREGLQKENFRLTVSRIPVVKALLKHLKIREIKTIRPYLCDQGLNSCVLEGESGIGKSELVVALLQMLGFKKAQYVPTTSNTLIKDNEPKIAEKARVSFDTEEWEKEWDTEIPCEKFFYQISSSDLPNLEDILKRAFHEGAIVLFDEINTLPDDTERSLNIYLSGTDLDDKPPAKPGFFIIATQNPKMGKISGIEYKGRKQASAAKANRCERIEVLPYDENEACEIFMAQGHEKVFAQRFARDFLHAVNSAIQQKTYIIPSFRDACHLIHAKTEKILTLKLFIEIQKLEKQEFDLITKMDGLLHLGANPNLIIKNGFSVLSFLMNIFDQNPAAQEAAVFCLIFSTSLVKSQIAFYTDPKRILLLEKAFNHLLNKMGPKGRSYLKERKSQSILEKILGLKEAKNPYQFFPPESQVEEPSSFSPDFKPL